MSARQEKGTESKARKRGCPKCGGHGGYTVKDRAFGWVAHIGIGWSGEEERADGEDGLRYVLSRTVQCDDCGARVPRPSPGRTEPHE